MRFLLLVISFILIMQPQTPAQEIRQHSFRVEFPCGRCIPDNSNKGNKEAIERLGSCLEETILKPDTKILKIRLLGSASPEGASAYNLYLAGKRLSYLENIICSRISVPDSIISRDIRPIDLPRMQTLAEESGAGYRDIVSEIIAAGEPDSWKLNALKAADCGKVWKEMTDSLFPEMRDACAIIITTSGPGSLCRIRPISPDNGSHAIAAASAEAGIHISETHSTEQAVLYSHDNKISMGCSGKRFCIGLKTNMLYDALLLPSAGIEIPAGRNWSVTAGWTHIWWNKDSRHRYWRYYGGDAGARWWFGKQHAMNGKLSGHHLGITGSIFTFDFETGGRGYMGGEPGGKLTDQACWAANAEYGYSLPIGRRLNIDFSFAAGYAGGKYYRYRPEDDCYVLQKSSKMHYIGPAKAEISLVWILGGRKGGAR